MSDEKQTHNVSTDALATLGTIIDETAGRDAIHLAVEPRLAAEILFAGQDVGLGTDGLAGPMYRPHVGIVDPFLKTKVPAGERFWLVVYPRQITSLRHVWEHPSFPNSESAKAKPELSKKAIAATAEAWLRDFCRVYEGPDYDELVTTLAAGEYENLTRDKHGYESGWQIDGDMFKIIGNDVSGDIPPEFWNNLEIVTGRMFSERAEYFSCSC